MELRHLEADAKYHYQNTFGTEGCEVRKIGVLDVCRLTITRGGKRFELTCKEEELNEMARWYMYKIKCLENPTGFHANVDPPHAVDPGYNDFRYTWTVTAMATNRPGQGERR